VPLGGVEFDLWAPAGDGTTGLATANRRRAWLRERHDLVEGEAISPFVRVALAAGQGTLYDKAGALGFCVVTAVANTPR
jgi:hypothetical protein